MWMIKLVGLWIMLLGLMGRPCGPYGERDWALKCHRWAEWSEVGVRFDGPKGTNGLGSFKIK